MSDSWRRARLGHRDHQAASIAASALELISQHGAPALTMAAIAKAADVSRQTLYRYYQDIDAVLVGIAQLVASYDEHFELLVAEEPNTRSQFDLIAGAAAGGGRHQHSAAALAAVLPPEGRDILTQHETRAARLLGTVLRRGIEDGSFRDDLDPETDPALILGLLAAADPDEPGRALALTRQLVDKEPKEQPR